MARRDDRPTLVIDNPEGLRDIEEALTAASVSRRPVGLDTETEGCDPDKQTPVETARLWCMTLATERLLVFITADVVPALRNWLESDAPKVGTNIWGYERHVFANQGIHLNGIVGDTLRMSRLLDPSKNPKQGGHGLKPWGEFLGYEVLSYKQVASRRKGGKESAYKRDRAVTKDGVTVHYTAGAPYQNLLSGTEVVSLAEIWDNCPGRRKQIVQYATQDAAMSLDAYWYIRRELEKRSW